MAKPIPINVLGKKVKVLGVAKVGKKKFLLIGDSWSERTEVAV